MHEIITTGLDQYIESAKKHPQSVNNSWVLRFKFPNNWGASVITGPMFYCDLERPFELGVLLHGKLHYDNPVADGDVRGYLTAEETKELLWQIKAYEHMS